MHFGLVNDAIRCLLRGNKRTTRETERERESFGSVQAREREREREGARSLHQDKAPSFNGMDGAAHSRGVEGGSPEQSKAERERERELERVNIGGACKAEGV